jgi:hypothetical protein
MRGTRSQSARLSDIATAGRRHRARSNPPDPAGFPYDPGTLRVDEPGRGDVDAKGTSGALRVSMSTQTILIILLVVILLGGGGFYFRGRG